MRCGAGLCCAAGKCPTGGGGRCFTRKRSVLQQPRGTVLLMPRGGARPCPCLALPASIGGGGHTSSTPALLGPRRLRQKPSENPVWGLLRKPSKSLPPLPPRPSFTCWQRGGAGRVPAARRERPRARRADAERALWLLPGHGNGCAVHRGRRPAAEGQAYLQLLSAPPPLWAGPGGITRCL